MKIYSPTLFIEINNHNFVFAVVDISENHFIKILYKNSVPIEGVKGNTITDHNLIVNLFKKNIYYIEQKLNFIFKEVIVILNNFDFSLINCSGYKKLNGSQLVKENITYLLNSLKSKITEVEDDKTILHIFNSNFLLDQKYTENLPIGLFGNFYSQELTFYLIKKNDRKNLENIFNKCNLKLNKIVVKNFIEGTKLINNNKNLNNFLKIEINKNNSQVIFFENSALKFKQDFKFGSDLIIQDISKVIGFSIENLKDFLFNSNFINKNFIEENIEKVYFKEQQFRKIKKKLIFEIADARIEEFLEILVTKNINLKSFLKKKDVNILIKLADELNTRCFKESYKKIFSNKSQFKLNFLEKNTFDDIYVDAKNIVQYGWKTEAVPIVYENKSFISRFFNLFFN